MLILISCSEQAWFRLFGNTAIKNNVHQSVFEYSLSIILGINFSNA